MGAIAAFVAVVCLLRIASEQRKLRATASVGILVTFAGDGNPGQYARVIAWLADGLASEGAKRAGVQLGSPIGRGRRGDSVPTSSHQTDPLPRYSRSG
jgi:hypothetical protein